MSKPSPALRPVDPALLAQRIGLRPLALVGMMGVGKSTVGRRLAQTLGFGFVDADDAIVAAAQMGIAEIFDRFGEAHFRDGERRVIARLLDQPRQVIATGGGAFVQPETRALILERAIAIWIDADCATLVERLRRTDKRPLLRGVDLAQTITRLKAEREPAYRQAHIHVQSTAGPHGEVARRILEALDQWL